MHRPTEPGQPPRPTLGVREFSVLHPKAIREGESIRSVLEAARQAGVRFTRGVNRQVRAEIAELVEIGEESLIFRGENFTPAGQRQLFLNFQLDRVPYFFAAELVSEEDAERIIARLPRAIFQAERRDRRRSPSPQRPVRLSARGLGTVDGVVVNESPGGMAVGVPGHATVSEGGLLEVRDTSVGSGRRLYGVIRGSSEWTERRGWKRLHLTTSPDRPHRPIPVRRIEDLTALGSSTKEATAERLEEASHVRLVAYQSEEGEEIRGIVNTVGTAVGAPAIIVPPGWGRTKETLLPLALTLAETFGASGRDLTVLRFDGVRKRGESYNDPACRIPGHEHHRFTFYQGVRDLRATARFLKEDPRFHAGPIVLVTFSASSIEGRKFLAEDTDGFIDGWVSVAGGSDLQSILRVISGGIDYIGGIEKGLQFGVQELLGVAADIDHAGKDAAEHGLSYLEEARQDMRRIRVPITWIQSRHDAWMDQERVRDILSRGDLSQRKLLDIPTGHQLRSSREALQAFRLVAEETSEILGTRIEGVSPPLDLIETARRAEGRRLRRAAPDIRGFWQDYLVGRSQGLGIELMNETQHFAALMDLQTKELGLDQATHVLDIGAGTGSFPRHLAKRRRIDDRIRITEVDLVGAGLRRARERLNGAEGSIGFVQARLGGGSRVPFRDGIFDAVLASLVLSYVEDPTRLLGELRRVLVPGGRLVVSSMKQDADISRIFTEALGQVALGEFDSLDVAGRRHSVLQASREFLNDVSRLLDLEEAGVFTFWPLDQLVAMVEGAGFVVESSHESFGDPPQAYVVTGKRTA